MLLLVFLRPSPWHVAGGREGICGPSCEKGRLPQLLPWFPGPYAFPSPAPGFSWPGPRTFCAWGLPASALSCVAELRIAVEAAPQCGADGAGACGRAARCSTGPERGALACGLLRGCCAAPWAGRAVVRGPEPRPPGLDCSCQCGCVSLAAGFQARTGFPLLSGVGIRAGRRRGGQGLGRAPCGLWYLSSSVTLSSCGDGRSQRFCLSFNPSGLSMLCVCLDQDGALYSGTHYLRGPTCA